MNIKFFVTVPGVREGVFHVFDPTTLVKLESLPPSDEDSGDGGCYITLSVGETFFTPLPLEATISTIEGTLP